MLRTLLLYSAVALLGACTSPTAPSALRPPTPHPVPTILGVHVDTMAVRP